MRNVFYKEKVSLLIFSLEEFIKILREIYKSDTISVEIFNDGLDIKTDNITGLKNMQVLKMKLAGYFDVWQVINIIGYVNRSNPNIKEIWVAYLAG